MATLSLKDLFSQLDDAQVFRCIDAGAVEGDEGEDEYVLEVELASPVAKPIVNALRSGSFPPVFAEQGAAVVKFLASKQALFDLDTYKVVSLCAGKFSVAFRPEKGAVAGELAIDLHAVWRAAFEAVHAEDKEDEDEEDEEEDEEQLAHSKQFVSALMQHMKGGADASTGAGKDEEEEGLE